MYVEYHVASGVAYLGIRVCGGVVEKPKGVCVCFLRTFLLLRGNGPEVGEHGWVDRNGII